MPPFRPGTRPGGGPQRSPLVVVDSSPVITQIGPNYDRVAGGSSITITGQNFIVESDGSGPSVFFGTTPATNVVVVSRSVITCQAPAHPAGLVDVSITTVHGQSGTLENAFSYQQPVITGISPDHGVIAGGTEVLILGGNFLPGSTFTFGGVAATNVTFIDAQHYLATTPAHAVGPVTVVMDSQVRFPGSFFFTLLTRGEDIRRNPSIKISERMPGPNTCNFVVDGTSSPPKAGEITEITDAFDGDRLLFAGIVVGVEQVFEGLITQLAWNISCVDYTFWLNRKRPFGVYTNKSVSSIVVDLCSKYAPWVDVSFVQTKLCNVNIAFDGSADFVTCLNALAKLLGGAHWYLDYDRKLHFFHVTGASGVEAPSPEVPSGIVENGSSGGLQPGVGTPMDLSRSSNTKQNFSHTPGYFVMCSTFVYDNGVESAPSMISNMVFLPSKGLPHLNNIPVGVAVGGHAVVKRRIYSIWFSPVGCAGWLPFVEILDNATTSYDGWPNAAGFSGSPAFPVVAPPPFMQQGRVPGVSESSTTSSQAYNTEFETVNANFSFSPGYYKFKYTNVYQNGVESQPTPESNEIHLDGHHAVDFIGPTGEDLNGVPVVYQNIYASFGFNANTPWGSVSTFGWHVVPGAGRNVTLNGGVPPRAEAGTISNTPTPPPNPGPINTLDPCKGDGPYLEDALAQPADINDTNTDLIRDGESGIRSSVDASQVRNRVYVRGAGTVTTANCVVGTQVIPVADTSGLAPGGGAVAVGGLGVSLQISGLINTTGAGAVNLVSPLTFDIPAGTSLKSTIVVNNIDSQKTLGAIEVDSDGNKTDGVHEYFIDDASLTTIQQQVSRGYAELELFSDPTVTVTYQTRDSNSHPGRKVNIDLTHPPLKGTFLIQSADIDQIHDESDVLKPRYTVTASSVKFTLDDLLLLIADKVIGVDQFSGVSTNGLIQTAVASVPTITTDVFKATLTLTSAQIDTLSSVPITIVPGVSGKLIVPIVWSLQDVRGSLGFNSTRTTSLLYRNSATTPIGTITMVAGASVSPTRRSSVVGMGSAVVQYDNTPDPVGQDLMVKNSGDMTGGDGTVWKITVTYYLADSL